MATQLELPALGQSMEEGTITRWLKAEGDTVKAGESLYEVMTDKVNIEVEATAGGVLRRILVPVDEAVPVGTPVAILGTADEDISVLGEAPAMSNATVDLGGDVASPAMEDSAAEARVPAFTGAGAEETASRVFASPRARRYADEYGVAISALAGRGTGIEGRIVEADVVAFYEERLDAQKELSRSQRVSPLAQKVAAVHGVSPLSVPGSGPNGKVLHGDVRRLIEPETTPTPSLPLRKGEGAEHLAPPPYEGGGRGEVPAGASAPSDTEVIKLVGMRKMVADAVAKSASTAPHVTLTVPVDMTEAMRFRAQVLPAIEKRDGVRVSITDIVAKAAARALLDHPLLNSTFQNNEITLHKRVHLGIAVSLGTEGLIVPVVQDAHTKSLGQFSKELKDKVARARAGSLAPNEVTGGTFSITNLGTFGVTQFNPVINPPQCAILGVCATVETVVPIAGVPTVRPMMNLCLSFDHRVADGAPAAAFLAALKETLEAPYLMFA